MREYGWAARGVTVADTKRGRKFQRINRVAAQTTWGSSITIVAPLCYQENTTAVFFEHWFKKAVITHVPKGVTIIMDNASFHRKQKLRNLARRHRVNVLFLPAYSPDLVSDKLSLENAMYFYKCSVAKCKEKYRQR